MTTTPAMRSRRAVYSVVRVAKLCRLSRARFYDLINSGVVPPPVYCVQTRRPMYTTELAARCVEVRETCTAIDGRYVLFHERRTAPQTPAVTPLPEKRKQPSLSPLMQEMVESLRAMGSIATEGEIVEAIRLRCPHGVMEESFEADLLILYGDLRRQRSA